MTRQSGNDPRPVTERTTQELLAAKEGLELGIDGLQRSNHRDWRSSRAEISDMQREYNLVLHELIQRRAIPDNPFPELDTDVSHAEAQARNRGFAWDHTVYLRLHQLRAMLGILERQELAADVEERELEAFAGPGGIPQEARDLVARLGTTRGLFLAGLRRGFALRGEVRPEQT